MTPDDAKARARKGEVLPVYLVVGEEARLRDEVVAAVRAAALDGGLADLNEEKLTAGESPVDRALEAAATLPMMAKRRVVVVRSVERWDGPDGGAREHPLDRLADYAASPSPTACVLLVAQKLDGRRKLVTLAKKGGFLVTCDPLDARALPGWIEAQAKARGHALAPGVADLVAELAGPDLGQLADVLDRLSLYVGEGAVIDDAAVAATVTRVRMADTWALVDAISRKDLARSLALLRDVYDPKDHGLPLLGALAWSVRQLARLEAALEGTRDLDAAAKKAGIYPTFRARELERKLRAFRPRELERWLVALGETDLALKSSRRPGDAIFEELLGRLCRRAA